MELFNRTSSDPSTFILMGTPGLEPAHDWISIPFTMFYVISLLGNVMVLFVVGKEQTLHKPMYLLLCMLALVEIRTSTSIVPKALCIFRFNFIAITVSGCLTQTFFLHADTMRHPAILVTMSFGHYATIFNPVRYATILTNARIVKLGLVGLLRSVLFILPMSLLQSRLPFCANHIIPHTYCNHVAVAKMSCGDITVKRIYGLVTAFVVMGLDLLLIALYYHLILRSVLRISSKKAYQKTLNTCTADLIMMLISYPTGLLSTLTYRLHEGIGPYVHSIMPNLHLLIPSILNPIVYGDKNKDICDKVVKCTFTMLIHRVEICVKRSGKSISSIIKGALSQFD